MGLSAAGGRCSTPDSAEVLNAACSHYSFPPVAGRALLRRQRRAEAGRRLLLQAQKRRELPWPPAASLYRIQDKKPRLP